MAGVTESLAGAKVGWDVVSSAISSANTDADKEQIVIAILKDVREGLETGKFTGKNIKMSAAADSLKEITEQLNKMPPAQLEGSLNDMRTATVQAVNADTELRKNADIQRYAVWTQVKGGQAQADYTVQTKANEATIGLETTGRAGAAEMASFKGKVGAFFLGFMEMFGMDTSGRFGEMMQRWVSESENFTPRAISAPGVRMANVTVNDAPEITFKPEAQRAVAERAQGAVVERATTAVGAEVTNTDARVSRFANNAGQVTASPEGGRVKAWAKRKAPDAVKVDIREPTPQPS